MKKKFLILLFISSLSYTQESNMNETLKNGVEYYFKTLIPKYYKGQKDFSEEWNTMPIGIHMQGNGFSIIKESNNITSMFYYLVDHKRQDNRILLLTEEFFENKLYEYWIIQRVDHGVSYKYSYFYLTEADSKQSKREIINVSKFYKDSYELNDGTIIDLSIRNLVVLYTAEPWDSFLSFKGTKYENKIVVWKKDTPILRNMNIFEKIYYKTAKKSKRED